MEWACYLHLVEDFSACHGWIWKGCNCNMQARLRERKKKTKCCRKRERRRRRKQNVAGREREWGCGKFWWRGFLEIDTTHYYCLPDERFFGAEGVWHTIWYPLGASESSDTFLDGLNWNSISPLTSTLSLSFISPNMSRSNTEWTAQKRKRKPRGTRSALKFFSLQCENTRS